MQLQRKSAPSRQAWSVNQLEWQELPCAGVWTVRISKTQGIGWCSSRDRLQSDAVAELHGDERSSPGQSLISVSVSHLYLAELFHNCLSVLQLVRVLKKRQDSGNAAETSCKTVSRLCVSHSSNHCFAHFVLCSFEANLPTLLLGHMLLLKLQI